MAGSHSKTLLHTGQVLLSLITIDVSVADSQGLSSVFFFLIFFLVALGFFAAHGPWSSCGEQGLLFVVVRRLLTAALVTERSL